MLCVEVKGGCLPLPFSVAANVFITHDDWMDPPPPEYVSQY